MPVEYRVVVHCKLPQCCYTISLPYSIPEGKNAVPRVIPTELFPLRVVCPECEQWFVYLVGEAQWGGFPTRGQIAEKSLPTSWIVDAQCGVQNCDSLTRWYVTDDSGIAFAGAADVLRRCKAICEHGHSLTYSRLRPSRPDSG
jgi:hypothetical protein